MAWVCPPEPKILEPHINASIWPTKDDQWAMGTLMLCERLPEGTSQAPSDTLVTWKDGIGKEYCLRPQTPRLPVPEYDPANKPAIARHFSSALFEIGSDILVKVKYAPVGWPRSEGAAMRLVKERAPSVPLPEVIHFWVDEEWDRYFLIQRRVHGEVMDDVWFKMDNWDKVHVTQEIAKHMKAISEIAAPRFQEADGSPIKDGTLLDQDPTMDLTLGMWSPRPSGWPGPFTPKELREHLREVSDGVEPPEIGTEFHFFHFDTGPGNIILTGLEIPRTEGKCHVHVAAIIDWEAAGFYPKFWIPFYVVSPLGAFNLSITREQPDEACGEYAGTLNAALTQLGFPDGKLFWPWFEEFWEAKIEALDRRLQEVKLSKAAEQLKVE